MSLFSLPIRPATHPLEVTARGPLSRLVAIDATNQRICKTLIQLRHRNRPSGSRRCPGAADYAKCLRKRKSSGSFGYTAPSASIPTEDVVVLLAPYNVRPLLQGKRRGCRRLCHCAEQMAPYARTRHASDGCGAAVAERSADGGRRWWDRRCGARVLRELRQRAGQARDHAERGGPMWARRSPNQRLRARRGTVCSKSGPRVATEVRASSR